MLTNWIVLILLFLYSVECVPSKDYLEGGNGDNESVQKFLLAKLKDVEKKLKVRIKNAKIQVRQDCLRTLKTHHETDSDKSSHKLLLKVNFLKIKNIKLAAEVKQFEQLIHLVVRNNTHGLQSHIDGLEASCAKTMVALETMNSKLEKLLNGTESDTEGPDLVFVEAITTTTIYVSWKPPVIKEPSGVIRGYYVYYIELNDQDEPMQSTQKVEDTGGVKKEEMVIVGVKPDTRYQVSVAGYTRKGDGIRSRAKIVTTKGAAPGSAPRNVHARPHSTTTIVIEWDEPEIPNGIIQGYKVFYTTKPDLPIMLWNNLEVNNANRMATVSSLAPNSTYTISVLAFSSMGQGPLSDPVQVLARQAVPQQPRNLKASPTSANEVEVTWKPPEDLDTIKSYMLYYNDSTQHTTGQIMIFPPVTQYILRELMPNTIYHIQMAGRSDLDEGAKTKLVRVRTPEYIPGKPKRVSVELINSTTIYVTWEQPRPNYGVIRGYFVFYIELNDQDEPIQSTQKMKDTGDVKKYEMVIVGLKPDTRYQVYVASYTRKGDVSHAKIITTKVTVPRGAPQNFSAVGQNENTVRIAWDLPAIQNRNGEIVMYQMIYYELADALNVEEINITGMQYDVTNLIMNTDYIFQIKAYNVKGAGPWSSRLQYRVSSIEYAAPKITHAPKNTKVVEDLIVSFFCEASGHPQPTFSWEKEGKVIQLNHKRYHIIDMPHGTVLRIEPVKPRKDFTVFTCVAKNDHGEVRANATLHVYPVEAIPPGHPRITYNPELKTVTTDRPATLWCAAKAETMSEPPSIYWLKDSIPVEMNDSRVTLTNDGTLIIEQSRVDDQGRYECVAENEVGVAYSYAAMLYVKVRRIPPHFTVMPDKKMEVKPNSDQNITCVAFGSPKPVVKWRMGDQELNPDDEPQIGQSILKLRDIVGTANYTCVAQSILGSIEAEIEVIVRKPPVPQNVVVTRTSPRTIQVTWDEPSQDNIIAKYKVYYFGYAVEDMSMWDSIETDGPITVAQITNLELHTSYAVRVQSNSINDRWSNLTEIVLYQSSGYS